MSPRRTYARTIAAVVVGDLVRRLVLILNMGYPFTFPTFLKGTAVAALAGAFAGIVLVAAQTRGPRTAARLAFVAAVLHRLALVGIDVAKGASWKSIPIPAQGNEFFVELLGLLALGAFAGQRLLVPAYFFYALSTLRLGVAGLDKDFAIDVAAAFITFWRLRAWRPGETFPKRAARFVLAPAVRAR